MNPGLARILATVVVSAGWISTAVVGYLRGLKKMKVNPEPVEMTQAMRDWHHAYRQDCGKDYYHELWVGICPYCKDRYLESKYYGSVDQYSDHWCNKCGFHTECEVLF